MRYVGRYTLGQFVPIFVQTKNSALTPTEPSVAPYCRVYGSGGFVKAVRLPKTDFAEQTGGFLGEIPIDGLFSAGHYDAIIDSVVSVGKGIHVRFEVVAGGNADGSAIEMHYFRHPDRNYLLAQLDTGRIKKLRNPRFSL